MTEKQKIEKIGFNYWSKNPSWNSYLVSRQLIKKLNEKRN